MPENLQEEEIYSTPPPRNQMNEGIRSLNNKATGPESYQIISDEYRALKNETPIPVMGTKWYQDTATQLQKDKIDPPDPMIKFRSCNIPLNQVRNRYTDVPCLETTRIKLELDGESDVSTDSQMQQKKTFTGLGGIFGSRSRPADQVDPYSASTDYINANSVSGYQSNGVTWKAKHYIAAQGPTDVTVGHFWEMILQKEVSSIVMTTQTFERKRQKCEQYWPNTVGSSMRFPVCEDPSNMMVGFLNNKSHCIEVKCNKVLMDKQGSYKITELEVEWQRSPKPIKKVKVNHCHFIDWPDHGIPDSAAIMIEFVKQVRKYDMLRAADYEMGLTETTYQTDFKDQVLKNPTLVHCSAGIGRTGTYIVVDQMLHHFERTRDNKDTNYKLDADFVRRLGYDIRQQRALAIQTVDQYRFCYKAVEEIIKDIYFEEPVVPKRPAPPLSRPEVSTMPFSQTSSVAHPQLPPPTAPNAFAPGTAAGDVMLPSEEEAMSQNDMSEGSDCAKPKNSLDSTAL